MKFTICAVALAGLFAAQQSYAQDNRMMKAGNIYRAIESGDGPAELIADYCGVFANEIPALSASEAEWVETEIRGDLERQNNVFMSDVWAQKTYWEWADECVFWAQKLTREPSLHNWAQMLRVFNDVPERDIQRLMGAGVGYVSEEIQMAFQLFHPQIARYILRHVIIRELGRMGL